MRIVVPFTEVHPQTRTWLSLSEHPVEYEYVGHSPLAYSELLRQLWESKQGFVICEHDMRPTYEVLNAMIFCPEPFCSASYDWGTNRGPAMGLVKFSTAFIRRYPFAARQLHGVSWKQMDWVFIRKVLAADLGEFPHVHLPAIKHLNPEKSPLSIHADKSDEWHLENLGFKVDETGKSATYVSGPFGDVKGFA